MPSTVGTKDREIQDGLAEYEERREEERDPDTGPVYFIEIDYPGWDGTYEEVLRLVGAL